MNESTKDQDRTFIPNRVLSPVLFRVLFLVRIPDPIRVVIHVVVLVQFRTE
jgi:hypothetical protein